MSWEYNGNFLTQFDAKYRGTIGDQICRIIREDDGLEIEEIIAKMQAKCRLQMRGESSDSPRFIFYEVLEAELESELAWEYIEFLQNREALPIETKRQLKNDWEAENQNAWMHSQTPTEKQLSYLKALGCKTIPTSKLEASMLINEFKKTRD